MLVSAIREALLATAGVQTVDEVVVHDLPESGPLVVARLGFGPSTPVSDVVAILDEVRRGLADAAPDASDIVLEPTIAPPRTDGNPPTDVFVIRGAD